MVKLRTISISVSNQLICCLISTWKKVLAWVILSRLFEGYSSGVDERKQNTGKS